MIFGQKSPLIRVAIPKRIMPTTTQNHRFGFSRSWELPLWPEFEDLIKSPIADIKNSGGKNGGAITAAAFLRQFVGTTPGAHLDIAGTAFLDKADGYRPAGATGVGVRLLANFVEFQATKATKRRAGPACSSGDYPDRTISR